VDPNLSGALGAAADCLRHLADDGEPGLRPEYERLVTALCADVGADPVGLHCDGGDLGARHDHVHGVRGGVGALLGLGVPWGRLRERLERLADLQKHDVDGPTEALGWEHAALYEIARTHLHWLAWTTSASSVVDYWHVLQLLDAPHEPYERPSSALAVGLDRRVHYGAARTSIGALDAFHLGNRTLGVVVDRLDREWAHDPRGGAAVGGA
jgi:hypothetical protein